MKAHASTAPIQVYHHDQRELLDTKIESFEHEAGKNGNWLQAINGCIVQIAPARPVKYNTFESTGRIGAYAGARQQRRMVTRTHISRPVYECSIDRVAQVVEGAVAGGYFASYEQAEKTLIGLGETKHGWTSVFTKHFLQLLESRIPKELYDKLIAFNEGKKHFIKELTDYAEGFFWGKYHRDRVPDFIAECKDAGRDKLNTLINNQLLLFKPEGPGPSEMPVKKHEQPLTNRNQDVYFNLMTQYKNKF